MTPLDRCAAEITAALATHGHPAWLVAIWHADWEAERWLLERDALALKAGAAC